MAQDQASIEYCERAEQVSEFDAKIHLLKWFLVRDPDRVSWFQSLLDYIKNDYYNNKKWSDNLAIQAVHSLRLQDPRG